MQDPPRVCELCSGPPHVYCNSDDAFLCFHCDSTVHQANFLVSRHPRILLCPNCLCLTPNSLFGSRSLSSSPPCASCSSDQDLDSISCCSSSNPSKSGASTAKVETVDQRNDTEVCEGKIGTVFANWCMKLGVNGDLVEPKAVQAMGLLCTGRVGRVLPLRLSLAASFWFGVRLSRDGSAATRQNLWRLARMSGVPAELIVSVDAKLQRGLTGRGRSRRRTEPEEGWAESLV